MPGKMIIWPYSHIFVGKLTIMKMNNLVRMQHVMFCFQVKYLGLMENLRVRRAGFAYRRPHKHFLQRYKSLCPETWPHYRGSDRQGTQVLVDHLGYAEDEYKLGK